MAFSLDKKRILERLSEIIDPELGINIVDLGLIYGVKISRFGGDRAVAGSAFRTKLKSEGRKPTEGMHVEIKMTLTSIGCPLAGFFALQVEEKVKQMKGVKDVHVHIVWEPPWTPERMSRKAKAALGLQ